MNDEIEIHRQNKGSLQLLINKVASFCQKLKCFWGNSELSLFFITAVRGRKTALGLVEFL